MKSILIIDDNDQGMDRARTLLRDHGYSVSDSDPDTDRFTRFAMDRACIQVFLPMENGRLIYVNEASCHSLGYGHEELTDMSVYDIAPYCTEEEYAALWRQVREQGDDRFEAVHQSKAGHTSPVEIQSNFIAFEEREYCCFVTDISERKRVEEKLLLHEFCIEKAAVGIFRVSEDGRISMANECACRTLGYSRDELCAMTVFDIDPAITDEKIRAIMEQAKSVGSVTHETAHRRRDGTTFPVEITSTCIEFNGMTYFYSFAKDISERKQAEQALRENERIFRLLTEISPNAIILIRGERIVYANLAAVAISGLDADELTGIEFWRFIHEDFRESARDQVLRLQRGEAVSKRNEYLILIGSGEERWALASSASIEYGGAPAIITTLVDITEAKRTEEALRESQARLSLAMEMARLVPWEFDAASGMFHFDDRFYALYGTSAAQEGGTEMDADSYVRRFVHPDDAATIMEVIKHSLAGEDAATGIQIEHRIIRADGEVRHISVRRDIIRDQEGLVAKINGANQDITELKLAEEKRKLLEEQLHQMQKLEAIGQLAGGIAHDFNNILTAIIGFAEIMEMSMEQGAPLRYHVIQILAATERAADLTQGLLAFSRKQVLHARCLDLREVIDGLRKMLRRLIPEDIDFKIRTAATEITVMADKGQLEQVLMNLVTNARDAMPGGGVLTIESGIGAIDEEFLKTNSFGVTGKYALITVTDSGCGMDAATREKVFEPFFTTKRVGKGTGLGLSIIYGIVKQHGGFITIDSSPGQGAAFRIYLPLAEREREEALEHRRTALPKCGNETILMVEDDEVVRDLNRVILEGAGYTVVEAIDGREALERFREQSHRMDIIISDIVMPNLDGKALHDEIMKIRPDIKVLFISGYAEEALDARGLFVSEHNFMPKPVKPSELLKRVRELLDHS
jgi:PAS domain S-box-containing protein